MPPQQSTQNVDPNKVGIAAQIIAGALMGGIISCSAVFVFVAMQGGKGFADQPGIISYVAVGFFVITTIASIVLPQVTAAQAIRKLVADQPQDWRQALAPVYHSKNLLSKAPLEGSAILNAVSFLIERHWMNLIVVVVILFLMAITFPSQSKFETWVEQVQRDHS